MIISNERATPFSHCKSLQFALKVTMILQNEFLSGYERLIVY
jgi:hypothetical protein